MRKLGISVEDRSHVFFNHVSGTKAKVTSWNYDAKEHDDEKRRALEKWDSALRQLVGLDHHRQIRTSVWYRRRAREPSMDRRRRLACSSGAPFRERHLGFDGNKVRIELFACHHGHTVTKMIEGLVEETERAIIAQLPPNQHKAYCDDYPLQPTTAPDHRRADTQAEGSTAIAKTLTALAASKCYTVTTYLEVEPRSQHALTQEHNVSFR
jgi:hypothetical protein